MTTEEALRRLSDLRQSMECGLGNGKAIEALVMAMKALYNTQKSNCDTCTWKDACEEDDGK